MNSSLQKEKELKNMYGCRPLKIEIVFKTGTPEVIDEQKFKELQEWVGKEWTLDKYLEHLSIDRRHQGKSKIVGVNIEYVFNG